MNTSKKPFDAVEQSRRWREETSKVLDAMTRAERIAFLATFGPNVERPQAASIHQMDTPSLVDRDETP